MIYEYQVLYRHHGIGPLHEITVQAESEREARAMIEGKGLAVHSIGIGRAKLDANHKWLDRTEAAAYLGVSVPLIDKMLQAGTLPRNPNRNLLRWERATLDNAMRKHLGFKGEIRCVDAA